MESVFAYDCTLALKNWQKLQKKTPTGMVAVLHKSLRIVASRSWWQRLETFARRNPDWMTARSPPKPRALTHPRPRSALTMGAKQTFVALQVFSISGVELPLTRGMECQGKSCPGCHPRTAIAAATPVNSAPCAVPGCFCDVASPANCKRPSQSGPKSARLSFALVPTALKE
jgi:hypothetical protein